MKTTTDRREIAERILARARATWPGGRFSTWESDSGQVRVYAHRDWIGIDADALDLRKSGHRAFNQIASEEYAR